MTGPASSWRDRRQTSASLPRDVYVLAIVAFLVMVGFGVVVPVLPPFVQSFGGDNLAVGFAVSSFALMRLLTSPWVPKVVAALGARSTLGIGMFIVAASSALVGFAANYPQLVVFRAMGGIGSAMFTVSAMVLLVNASPANRRGRTMSFYQGGFLLGGMAGPAVGGLLAQISLTAPFFFYAGTLTAAGVVALVLIRPTDATSAKRDTAVVPLRTLLGDSRYQAACVAGFANGWSSMGVRNSLIPIFVVSTLMLEPAWTGYAFAIAAVVQTITLTQAGKWSDTLGRRPVMIAGGLIAAGAMMAVPFVGSYWLLVVVLCFYGIAAALQGTAPAALVGDIAGGRSGPPFALWSMTVDFGSILGPLAAGWLADHTSLYAAYGISAAFLALGALMAIRMPGGRPTDEDADTPSPYQEQHR
ncbi:MFS transporter [Parenemella sanctibonifatiensis]|nr:MFS transporter [Parenemella sanctibonifatiensis]